MNLCFVFKKDLTLQNAEKTGHQKGAVVLEVVKAFSKVLIVGLMAVTFVLSLAAIIYAGPLAPFLRQGIGITLLGAIIMAVVGPFMLSYRGTLVQPQDVSTILLSLSAASIATLPDIRSYDRKLVTL